MLIRIRNIAILAFLLGIFEISDVWAQTQGASPAFKHPDLGFELQIPDSFEQFQTTGEPVVAIALKQKGADFPTFNVLSQAGSFEPSRDSLISQAKLIRDNYRALGLESVKIRVKKLIDVGSGAALKTELDYLNQGKKFKSVVVLVPGKMRHFILTFIDTQDGFTASEAILNNLLLSFKIPDHALSTGKADSFPPIWAVVLALLVLLALFKWKSKASAGN